jgi:hypothetical protein
MIFSAVCFLGDCSGQSKIPEDHRITAVVYALFIAVAFVLYHVIAEGEFSSVLTLSSIAQCLAFSLLSVQALSNPNVGAISVKSLMLDAFAIACRLSSTVWLVGYLPNDTTGNGLYQAFDGLSLCMACWLLYRLHNAQHRRQEEQEDVLPAAPFALGSLLLAGLFHGNMDEEPLFDTLWMCSIFVSAVAVIPQLRMMTHRRGSVPALTSHFVAVTAIGRLLSGLYMWHAYPEIECDPVIADFNHAGYFVIAAHALHLLLLGEFFYIYSKNVASSGWNAPLKFGECVEV